MKKLVLLLMIVVFGTDCNAMFSTGSGGAGGGGTGGTGVNTAPAQPDRNVVIPVRLDENVDRPVQSNEEINGEKFVLNLDLDDEAAIKGLSPTAIKNIVSLMCKDYTVAKRVLGWLNEANKLQYVPVGYLEDRPTAYVVNKFLSGEFQLTEEQQLELYQRLIKRKIPEGVMDTYLRRYEETHR